MTQTLNWFKFGCVMMNFCFGFKLDHNLNSVLSSNKHQLIGIGLVGSIPSYTNTQSLIWKQSDKSQTRKENTNISQRSYTSNQQNLVNGVWHLLCNTLNFGAGQGNKILCWCLCFRMSLCCVVCNVSLRNASSQNYSVENALIDV